MRGSSVLFNKNKRVRLSNMEHPNMDLLKTVLMENMDEDGHHKKHKNIHRELNHIYFYTDISTDSIYELTALLREAEEENIITSFKLKIDPIPIYLHMSSYGGEVDAGFLCVSYIKNCKVPVYAVAEGANASASTLIILACEKRYIMKESTMLIHQLSSGFWGKMNQIEDEYQNLSDLMKKIKDFYKENTKLKTKQLNELLKHDLWLDEERCIEYGLADEIYDK